MTERYERPRFHQGLTSLERMARNEGELQHSYLSTAMFPKHVVMQFDKKWIKIGVRHRKKDPGYDKERNSFMLKMGEPIRMLVLGATGSGKTVMIRRLLDSLHHSGAFSCALLTDIKDEMKTSMRPAPAKQARSLDDDDIPTALPMKVYRPMFFSKFFEEKLPRHNYPFRLAYKDLNVSELLTLLGFADDAKRNARDVVTNHYRKAKSLPELRTIIDRALGGSERPIKDSIFRAIDPLIQFDVLGEEPVGDFVADMQNGIVPVLNVQKYERVGLGSATIPQVYVAVVQRKIVEAREQRILKKRVVLFIDEAPKFLVPGTLTFTEFLKAVDLYRQKKIYMVFAAQTNDRVPDSLIEQCRYIFFPFNAGPDTARKILSKKQYFIYHPNDIENLARRMRRLQMDSVTGWRQWIFVDSNKELGDSKDKLTSVFWALPALSAHAEPQ